jgi:poly-gamma-glutamate capsule biosynthesis protein CapA/YwtB (metallophosphatase superfamily)
MRGPARSPALRLALAACCALLLAACAGRAGSVALDADAGLLPRLKLILAEEPLPEGWTIAENSGGAGSSKTAELRISLSALPLAPSLAGEGAPCGLSYLAAPADLSENLYSVSPSRAEELGLLPLESIVLPRRALAVDDAWPGSPGYPFARRLVLVASRTGGGAPPRAIARWVAAAAAKATAADAAPLLVTAAGDIQVGEAEGSVLLDGERGIRGLIAGGVLERLRAAGIAVANLESPVSSRGEANPKKRYHFRMPSGSSAALKEAGFGLVLFGNNHAFDYGNDAFLDTLDDLAKAALPMVGAGRSLKEAAAARFLEPKRGDRLAFVGYAFYPDESLGFTRADAAAGADRPGVSADEAAALAAVRQAAASGATVVVLAHGGSEYVERPSEAARELYARFVDAGAALVVGTHPHVLQGCEARSGSLIAYSLGNFLFTLEDEPPAAWKGAMLDFLIYRGKVRGVMPRPIIAGYYRTEPDPDRASAEARFSGLCAGLGR